MLADFTPQGEQRHGCVDTERGRGLSGRVGAMRQAARVVTATMIVTVAVSTSGFASEWPWIYGPRRDNTSEQKGLLRTWPAAGPEVLWTVPVGVGFGGPAISDGK